MAHQIFYTLRLVAPADLPTVTDLGSATPRAATATELLQMDMVLVGTDPVSGNGYYSCAEQYRGPHSQALTPWGHTARLGGTVIASGRDRYRNLPDAHRPHVLRARVIRAADPAHNAVTLATAKATPQPNPTPDAILAAAQAMLAAQPSVSPSAPAPAAPSTPQLVRDHLPMAAVDLTIHIKEEDSLIPHSWHGETVTAP